METTRDYIGLCGIIGCIWGLYRDNVREHGNYRDSRGYIGAIFNV